MSGCDGSGTAPGGEPARRCDLCGGRGELRAADLVPTKPVWPLSGDGDDPDDSLRGLGVEGTPGSNAPFMSPSNLAPRPARSAYLRARGSLGASGPGRGIFASPSRCVIRSPERGVGHRLQCARRSGDRGARREGRRADPRWRRDHCHPRDSERDPSPAERQGCPARGRSRRAHVRGPYGRDASGGRFSGREALDQLSAAMAAPAAFPEVSRLRQYPSHARLKVNRMTRLMTSRRSRGKITRWS